MAWPKGVSRRERDAAKTAVPERVVDQTDAKAATPAKKQRWVMKAGSNWEEVEPATSAPDRLHIPRDMFPEDMDLQWVTRTVFGQEFPQRVSAFFRRGWTQVHPEDFDGRFDGMFSPRGSKEPIEVDGLLLVARPLEFSLRAKKADQMAAREQVAIKEAALTGGHMEGVTGASHPSAVGFNHIRKSIEQVEVAKE